MDRVILGENCYLDDGIGTLRPNNNQIIVGCSGTGKSMSVMLPTMLNMDESSLIATYSKPSEARKIGAYLQARNYKVKICDLTNPKKGNVSFDPMYYLNSHLDVEDLANSIVLANPNSANPKDTYWNDGASCLLKSLMEAALMTQEDACMTDVLEMFDKLSIRENGKGITTSLDDFFVRIAEEAPDCQAVTSFMDFRQLPYATAGCVRDTLAKAIRRLFPEPIRKIMRKKETINFIQLAAKKTALIIITSPVNSSLYFFANLLFGTAIKQLLEFAEQCKGEKLPRPVRLMFDDFACAATINNYCRHIAIFRAAGLSSMMLIQSESQLRSLYGEDDATTILNNCSTYVYFPGGMDLLTCRSISQRMDVPMTDIMYAPTGNVIVMCSGQKPVIVPRYDIMNSKEYQQFLKIVEEDNTFCR